jgi:hypothetical protein
MIGKLANCLKKIALSSTFVLPGQLGKRGDRTGAVRGE